MARRCSRLWARVSRRAARRAARATVARRLRGFYMRAGLKLVLTVHHDAFSRSKTLLNQRLPALDLRDLQWTHPDRLVVLKNKRERALRPALNHRRRDHRAVPARGEQQAG